MFKLLLSLLFYFCCHNRTQKLYYWAMEKKQKIAIKKLQFAIVISVGSNCPGVIIRGQCNSPWWELSEEQLSQVEIVLGGGCPAGSFLEGGIFLAPLFPRKHIVGIFYY